MTSRLLKIGGASAGFATIASDFHDYGEQSSGLLADHESVVREVNPDVDYEFVDPDLPGLDLPSIPASHFIVHCNDPVLALARLQTLVDVGLTRPTLLLWTADSLSQVMHFASPTEALASLRTTAAPTSPDAFEGPPELAMVTAGLALHQVMVAGQVEESRVGLYDLAMPRRTPMTFELPTSISSGGSVAARAALQGKRGTLVGTGALGGFLGLGVALTGQAQLACLDGDDEIEEHNLSRQPLLVGRVGEPKAPVVAERLQTIDPQGKYTAVKRFVDCENDLDLADSDYLLVAPDNDKARLVASSAARRTGVMAVLGGTSPEGGQVVVQGPGGACFACVTGLDPARVEGRTTESAASCAAAEQASIVSTNMLIAGLMLSELRAALAGSAARNLRLQGSANYPGNRLAPMATPGSCPHVSTTAEFERSDASQL